MTSAVALPAALFLGQFLSAASAVKIVGCRGDSSLEVSKTANKLQISCERSGIRDSINWQLITPTFQKDCSSDNAFKNPSLNCDLDGTLILEGNFSELYEVHKSVNISCLLGRDARNSASCQLDFVEPSAIISCGPLTATSIWSTNIRCAVTQGFSSLGNYHCLWFQGTSKNVVNNIVTGSDFEPLGSSPSLQNSCNLTVNLEPKGGSYYYRLIVFPGAQELLLGPLVLVAPMRPVITCSPTPWTRISRYLSCSCTTEFIGYPAGMLEFYRGGVGTLDVAEEFGLTSLEMTPQLVKLDELFTDKAYFSCRVRWIANGPSDTHTVMLEEDSDLPLILALVFGILGGLLLLILCILLIRFWIGRQDRPTRKEEDEDEDEHVHGPDPYLKSGTSTSSHLPTLTL